MHVGNFARQDPGKQSPNLGRGRDIPGGDINSVRVSLQGAVDPEPLSSQSPTEASCSRESLQTTTQDGRVAEQSGPTRTRREAAGATKTLKYPRNERVRTVKMVREP